MRSDDIVISTYPKCGTTWTQRIVGMMVFGSAAPFPVQDISPWPDFRLPPPGAMRGLAESQTHPRFLKSHLPFDALPHYEGVKYIHVARDGRDAAMSFFHHKSNYTPESIARASSSSATPTQGSVTETAMTSRRKIRWYISPDGSTLVYASYATPTMGRDHDGCEHHARRYPHRARAKSR